MKTIRDNWLLAAAVLWMFIGAAALVFLVSGCKAVQFGKAGVAPEIVAAQKPGVASGAGATITGPTNTAAPTTQIAERKAWYFPAGPFRYGKPANATTPPVIINAAPQQEVPPEPQPSATYEHTETTFGQHQSASAVIQAAAQLDGLNKVQWLGIFAIIGGIAALLWSAGHDKGYPLIYVKIVGIGVVLLLVGNPWYLLLGLIPLAFYAAQKFGILKLP